MPEEIVHILGLVARLLEIVGAAALVLGFVVATIVCINEFVRERKTSAVKNYRQALGRTVLLGLEILVAATIIKTITLDPTFEGISLLAIMVAIRTTLGWTMELEINGHWPWQKQSPSTENSQIQ